MTELSVYHCMPFHVFSLGFSSWLHVYILNRFWPIFQLQIPNSFVSAKDIETIMERDSVGYRARWGRNAWNELVCMTWRLTMSEYKSVYSCSKRPHSKAGWKADIDSAIRCVKWACLWDCLFWKVTNIGWNKVGKVRALRTELRCGGEGEVGETERESGSKAWVRTEVQNSWLYSKQTSPPTPDGVNPPACPTEFTHVYWTPP